MMDIADPTKKTLEVRNDITYQPKMVLQARFPEEVVVAKERVYKMLQDNGVWDSVVGIHLNYRLTVMEMQLTSQEDYERLLTAPLYFKGRDRDILVYFSDASPSIVEVTLNNVPLGMDFQVVLKELEIYGNILTTYPMKSTFGSKTFLNGAHKVVFDSLKRPIPTRLFIGERPFSCRYRGQKHQLEEQTRTQIDLRHAREEIARQEREAEDLRLVLDDNAEEGNLEIVQGSPYLSDHNTTETLELVAPAAEAPSDAAEDCGVSDGVAMDHMDNDVDGQEPLAEATEEPFVKVKSRRKRTSKLAHLSDDAALNEKTRNVTTFLEEWHSSHFNKASFASIQKLFDKYYDPEDNRLTRKIVYHLLPESNVGSRDYLLGLLLGQNFKGPLTKKFPKHFSTDTINGINDRYSWHGPLYDDKKEANYLRNIWYQRASAMNNK